VSDLRALAASLPAPTPRRRRCRRCGQGDPVVTISVQLNEPGPKRNGCGKGIASRTRTVCERCTLELATRLFELLDSTPETHDAVSSPGHGRPGAARGTT
jgi:hypothetical protein